MAISTKRDVHKKYTVSAGGGTRLAKTDTLEEAKRAGVAIAKKEAWRGKWNVMYLALSITKQVDSDSIHYRSTGWTMFIPVRGSGASADHIIAEIRRREGAAPFKWVKRGGS